MSQAEAGSMPLQASRGIVKQVLSGDAVVIRGQPRGGPPPTRTVALSNIMAPRLARRANPNVEDSVDTHDEPHAWEAREFLRKLLVGKEVKFVVEHKTSSNREYGSVWLAADGRNVSDLLLNEGLVEVRQGVRPSEELSRLLLLESAAKASEKGKWSKNTKKTVRNITWSMTNDELRTFVQRNQGKQLEAVVEYVRDGSTLRVMVIPTYIQLTVAMSGVKSAMFKRDGDSEVPEPFAEMAKFFTESRLLQQDVKLLIEGVSNQLVMATVIHPMGNIAERLVKEGFARCVDWSMAMVSKDKDKLRTAEKAAKEQQLRIWKGYQPSSSSTVPQGSRTFSGKVVEVVNGDALVIKKGDQQYQKIWFSSLRPPRSTQKDREDNGSTTRRQQQQQQRIRPLYDIPFMWDAREFLRKKLIGKKVNVRVDYIKPAQDSYPEKTCCTVTREDVNIAVALISKGLAYCLRHRQDDDQRSSQYDELMGAEARAIKNGKGVHSKKEPVAHRVAELSGDPTKAKQFLPFLQRAGKTVALVEFIASGSRVRLYLPKDSCLISFLLAGVSCPRAPRDDANPGDEYGQQALLFTKELIMQSEVEVEVEACDKGGNFIGWLYIEGKNLSIALLEEGLSKAGPQADRSSHARALFAAEERAKASKKNLWKDFVEPVAQDECDDVELQGLKEETSASSSNQSQSDRKCDYQKVVVTEITSCCNFWIQFIEQGPQLEQQMQQLRKELAASPPIPGSFTPKKGVSCLARFTDGLWYRAMVEKVLPADNIQVLFIDFGNRSIVSLSQLAALPAGYGRLPPQAKECFLAYVAAPTDYQSACGQEANGGRTVMEEDWLKESTAAFTLEVQDQVLLMNVEYRSQGQDFVSLLNVSDSHDIAAKLISDGLLRTDRRGEKQIGKLVAEYTEKETEARKSRVNIWRYGDFTPDDCQEFGYQK